MKRFLWLPVYIVHNFLDTEYNGSEENMDLSSNFCHIFIDPTHFTVSICIGALTSFWFGAREAFSATIVQTFGTPIRRHALHSLSSRQY